MAKKNSKTISEEIKEEALVRNLDAFHRFLEVAALTDGEIINNNNIAQECGVHATTVSSYFDILEDTLIGYRIPAYTKVMQRRLVQAPRFYYFDIGIVNYLLHRNALEPGSAEFGHAFEHLIVRILNEHFPRVSYSIFNLLLVFIALGIVLGYVLQSPITHLFTLPIQDLVGERMGATKFP